MISFAKVTAEVYAGLTPVEDRVYYITDTGEMFLNGVKYCGGDQAQADWDQSDSTAVDFIKDKPVLADVATTGNYYSLSNRPYVPNATGNWFGIWHDQADSTATTITLSVSGTNARANTFQYCTNINTNNWTDYTLGTALTLTQYQYVLWRNKDSAKLLGNNTGHYVFSITGGGVYLSGNIMSLKDKGGQYNDFTSNYEFYEMFKDCTAIKDASMLELPASVANSYSCYGMFNGCTGMVRGPAILPATTLGTQCYRFMFNGCTSLVKAPELPATALASMCYHYMFGGCTSLTEAPYLPATTVPSLAYNFMFNGCTNLKHVRTAATALGADNSQSWLYGVSENGVIECHSALDLSTRGADTVPAGWTVVRTDQPHADWNESDSTEASYIRNKPAISGGGGDADYLCMELARNPENKGVYLSLNKQGSPSEINLEYSTDKQTWTTYTWDGTAGYSILLTEVGAKVWFRAASTNSSFSSSVYNYYRFVGTNVAAGYGSGAFNASGNIMSLVDKTCNSVVIPGDFCFRNLFWGNIYIYSAYGLRLPATTLKASCYISMFDGQSYLTKAPKELPATTLATSCYARMFYGCSKIVNAPDLPATTLATYCYNNMFYGCTSLASAPALPAMTMADHCYANMFQGCTYLYSAPDLPATTLASYCYYRMFYGCTHLTKAMEVLPATTLASYAYNEIFSGCTSLKRAPEFLAENAAFQNSMCGMFDGCSNLEYVPDLHVTSLYGNCFDSCFRNCVKLTVAPEVPATTGVRHAFERMFYGCTGLKYYKCNLTSLSTEPFATTFSGITGTGVFDCPSTVDPSSVKPANWITVHGANTPDEETTSIADASTADTFAVCPGQSETGVITVASALTLSAGYTPLNTAIAYAEVVIDLQAGATVTAGSNIVFKDEPAEGCRNICVVRWQDGSATLYVVDTIELS